MRKKVFFKTVAQYNKYMGVDCSHPEVTVVDYSKLPPILFADIVKVYGFYVVFLKGRAYTALKYGRNTYDYRENELVFAAPEQAMGSVADGKYHKAGGYALAFHPDFVARMKGIRTMRNYPFFSYSVKNGLPLAAREKNFAVRCMKNIQAELGNPDTFSDTIIWDNIKLLLDNCGRFFERRFGGNVPQSGDILSRFEAAVSEYLDAGAARNCGKSVVQFCAERLSLSPSYLGYVVKSETGISALKCANGKILERASELLCATDKSIAEIAEDLGFTYPQHFSRWFKNETGTSPKSFRSCNS